jgi:hypothetical protein
MRIMPNLLLSKTERMKRHMPESLKQLYQGTCSDTNLKSIIQDDFNNIKIVKARPVKSRNFSGNSNL